MRDMTFLEGFRSIVRRYPEEIAVVTPAGAAVTYRDLDRRTEALAASLDETLGDQRCAVLSENRLAVVESMIAAMKRGRANVQLFTRSPTEELVYMARAGEAGGIIFDRTGADRAAELADRCDMTGVIGIGEASAEIGEASAYENAVSSAESVDRAFERAPAPGEAAVFFSSGTSGKPKAVLVDQEQAWLAANQPALEMSLTASDRALVCTPWYHQVTANTWIMAHLLVGGTLALQRSFEPPEVLRAIDEHEITGLLAVPTQLVSLLDAAEQVEADLETLSYIRTGGAIVPDELIDRTREELSEGVFNTYGLTEGVINLSFAYPDEQVEHPGTIGKSSFLWDLRVVEAAEPPAKPDPENVVEPGESGEIIGKSPKMIDGYLDKPERDDDIFVDGWLRTGDVARVDHDGFLVVTGRVDNMIVSGGENIYPEEVCHVLEEHPGVRQACVVGRPDDTWGEVVCAAVVVEDGVTKSDLERHCKDHDALADFKRPRQYVVLSEDESLPRTATGTVQRNEVESLFDPT